jgi:2-polyprenyl-3-methyl-5-hydroxy-6-metoxy-1,4-benzoquinol methylase
MVETSKYGSRAWIDSQYAASEDDPWGLDWRPSQQYRYRRMFDALKQVLVATQRPLDVVDVGCATGAFTAMLGGLNPEAGEGSLVGVDIAEAAVARATARFPLIRFDCIALDECARTFEGSADVVTCMEVLYYLPAEQRVEAARQLSGMLKPGGWLLVSSMIASAPYFSLDQLKALLAKELDIIETGVLYLKPIAVLEKLLMKLGGPAARKALRFDRCSHYSERWLASVARSHAYVIARHG